MTKEEKYLDNNGYGTGRNLTLKSVAYLLKDYAARAIADHEQSEWNTDIPKISTNLVQVTCIISKRLAVDVAAYMSEQKRWVCPDMSTFPWDVIAWREFPAPYREEGE